MRFGAYECGTVIMDSFRLDGGAMFGVVPKALWAKAIVPDDENRIPMVSRSLIIQGRSRVILVDTGVGDKLPEKFKQIYGIEVNARSMDERLAALGLTCNEITDVVLSHLHFDHAGGSTCRGENGVRPTFLNATYHVQKSQWDLACRPSLRDRSSYIPDNFQPLREHGVLHLVDGPRENFFDGIHLTVTNGHTTGHQHLLVAGQNRALFFCGDLIPTSAHVPIAWHMAYDNHPIELMAEKAAVLKRALSENWVLCFAHDPVTAGAEVAREKGKMAAGPAVSL